MVYIYTDWGKFILMKWLTVFWLLANLKTTGQPRRLATQGRVDMAARVQSHLEAESLLPWRIQCFSFKAFSWLDEIQPHYGRSSCFTTFFFFSLSSWLCTFWAEQMFKYDSFSLWSFPRFLCSPPETTNCMFHDVCKTSLRFYFYCCFCCCYNCFKCILVLIWLSFSLQKLLQAGRFSLSHLVMFDPAKPRLLLLTGNRELAYPLMSSFPCGIAYGSTNIWILVEMHTRSSGQYLWNPFHKAWGDSHSSILVDLKEVELTVPPSIQ